MADFRGVLLLYAALTIPTRTDGVATLSSLGLPLPDIPTGYVYNNGNPLAPFQIDMFGNLLCKDFRASLPVLKEVADWYGPNLVCLKIHLFPLPFQKYTFLTHKVLHIVEPYLGINGTFDFMDRILADRDKFSGVFLDRTEGQVYDELVYIAETFDMSAAEFWKGINSDAANNRARVEFKYACHRGVAGTPTFFVNGIMVKPVTTSADGQFGLEQWKEVLDPMLVTEDQRQHLARAVGAATLSSLGLPLPDIPTGYVYNNGNPLAPIQIEMFGNLLCTDFHASFPVMKEVADWYGPNLVCLKIHLFPLPFLKYAFLTHQVLHIVEPYLGINGTFDFMDRILADRDKFSGDVLNRTEGQVYDELVHIVETFGVPAAEFWEGINSDAAYNRARVEFKYACHRGVAGTPTFFVNGIMVNPVTTSADGQFGLEQWKEVLDPMLGTADQKKQKEQLAASGFSYGTCPSKSRQQAGSGTATSSAILTLLTVVASGCFNM